MGQCGRDILRQELRKGTSPEVWIRFPRQLGDVIFALPFLGQLQEDWNAVAAEEGKRLKWIAVGHAIGAALFSEAHPDFISECVVESGGKGKPDPWHLLKRWRKTRPVAVLNLSQSVRLMFGAYMARVPIRAGIADNHLSLLYTHPFKYRDLDIHLVQRYEPLLEKLTSKSQLAWFQLTPDKLGGSQALDKLKAAGWTGKPYVCLAFGTRGYSKRWMPEREKWPELARILLSQGLDVVWLGGPDERPLGAELCAMAPGSLDLTGQTSIPEACCLQYHAYGTVAVDTGLTHSAGAVGRPCVTVNSHSPEPLCNPMGPHVVMIRGAVADTYPGESQGNEWPYTYGHRIPALRVANVLMALAAEADGKVIASGLKS